MRSNDSCSMPLVSEITGASDARSGATRRKTSRYPWEGTAITTAVDRSTAFARSSVAIRESGKGLPGR